MASAHRNDVSQAEILLWTGGLLGTTSWKMIWKLRPWLWSFREKWYPLSKLFPIWWTHTFNSDWIIEIFYNSAAKGKPTRNSVIDKDLSNRGKTNWKLMKIKEWTFENSVHLHQFLSLFIFLHFILSLFFLVSDYFCWDILWRNPPWNGVRVAAASRRGTRLINRNLFIMEKWL